MRRYALAPYCAPARRQLSLPATGLVAFAFALFWGHVSGSSSSVAAAELSAGNYLVMSDGRLFEVDHVTGDRELLGPSTLPRSSYGLGGGIAIDAHWNIYFANADAGAIYHFDLETDETSVVSGSDGTGLVGSGLALSNPLGLTFGPEGELLVADSGLRAIVSIDPASGNRTVISGGPDNIGQGDDFFKPHDVLLTSSGQLLAGGGGDVGGEEMNALLAIDLDTGDRIPISRSGSSPVGGGPDFRSNARLSPGPGDSILMLGSIPSPDLVDPRAIFQVDLATGNRSVLFEAPGGGPVSPPDISPLDSILEDDGNLLILDVGRSPGIRRFNPATGELQYLSYSNRIPPFLPIVGEGPAIRDPRFIVEIPARIPEPGVATMFATVAGVAAAYRRPRSPRRTP